MVESRELRQSVVSLFPVSRHSNEGQRFARETPPEELRDLIAIEAW
jgi:hypothetical protein